MLTDERLNALIRGAELDLHDAERNQEHQERIEWYRDVLTALQDYQSLRRRDAAIDAFIKNEHGCSFIHATCNNKSSVEVVGLTGKLSEGNYFGDTFAAALSALAAGLEGET